jgi:hypothetical protein
MLALAVPPLRRDRRDEAMSLVALDGLFVVPGRDVAADVAFYRDTLGARSAGSRR